MKSKGYFMTFLMIAGFIGLLFLSSVIGNSAVTTLAETFPDIQKARNFEGILLSDESRKGSPLLLTDSQYLAVLPDAQLKDLSALESASFPAIKLHFSAAEQDYHVTVCRDGKISMETGDHKRFFLDSTGSLFRTLYEEHLLSGGQALPE